jgi:hypothetical protein
MKDREKLKETISLIIFDYTGYENTDKIAERILKEIEK